MDQHLKSKATDPPHLVLFKDEESDTPRGIFIVGHGTYIKCDIATKDDNGRWIRISQTLRGAYINLIAVYFAFQLDYPIWYTGALGVLQEHMLGAGRYTLYRSSGFNHFAANLKKEINALEVTRESMKNNGSPVIDTLMR